MSDLISVDPLLLAKRSRAVPRYTSYPTAVQFNALSESTAISHLRAFDGTGKPLSLYIHIPFCRSMCLFCGCSVILNRRPERQAAYLDALLQEIHLTANYFSKRRTVTQLHLGGGTPTSLTEEEFAKLMAALRTSFDFAPDAEIAIEIDPRTVFADQGKKLETLRKLGFNRVSFGVQDLDAEVQEAVKRRQSEEMTVSTYQHARSLGFDGINIDLIYGLPLQSAASFRKTAEKIAELKPDRIAFFSYAKVPWLREHQKAIREQDLPNNDEKFRIYVESRQTFMEAGYTAIGMDHFALREDSLAIAYREKKLYRNFQGYAVEKAEDLLGFGVTSIGFMEGAFLQNVKTLEDYSNRCKQGILPVFRGYELSSEDTLRRAVIQEMMCRFSVDKIAFEEKFGKPFDAHFHAERARIEELKADGLIEEDAREIRATAEGRLFIRLVAVVFDAYFVEAGKYSSSI